MADTRYQHICICRARCEQTAKLSIPPKSGNNKYQLSISKGVLVSCHWRGSTKWEDVLSIKNSMYLVEYGGAELCLECEANPYHLVCRVCKGFAHDGICKHVLAVTHIIERKKPKHEQNQRLNLKRLNKVAASNT